MAEYIEREALKVEVESLTMTVTGMRSGKGVLYEALKAYRAAVLSEITEAPAADVVEVVRCKDCRHSDMIEHTRYCFHWERNTDDDGFCYEGV